MQDWKNLVFLTLPMSRDAIAASRSMGLLAILDRGNDMGTVTYKNQPGTAKTLKQGTPLAGTSHIYTVAKVLWPDAIEAFLKSQFIGRTLHMCCGASQLGDIRLDIDEAHSPDIVCDAADMSEHVRDGEFDTVLCDPPYNGKLQWNHDVLSEMIRAASRRVIFQHWFLPANKDGGFKKAKESWALAGCYIWQPRTYFGRVQVVSVFDHV